MSVVLIVHADGTLENLEEVRAHLLSPSRIAITRNFLRALMKYSPATSEAAKETDDGKVQSETKPLKTIPKSVVKT